MDNSDVAEPAPSNPGTKTYTVKAGDTLTRIADRFVDGAAAIARFVAQIKKLNGLKSDLIKVNDILILP